jgi:hypothetical protein
MGYTWNKEINHPKAVLWQTNTGGNHFNHLHVSNKTGETSGKPTSFTSDTTSGKPTSSTSDKPTSSTSDKPKSSTSNITLSTTELESDPLIRQFGSILNKALNLDKGLTENIKRIKGLIK